MIKNNLAFMISSRILNRLVHYKKLLIIILTLMSFYFIVFSTNSEIKRDSSLKYVQLYTGVFDYKNWDQGGIGRIPFQGCPEDRCFAVKTFAVQSAMEYADGVMVHGPNLWYLPSRSSYKRNKKQIWLYYALESPRGSICSMHYNWEDLDDWFNLTVTYKLDSDLVSGYSPVDKIEDIENLGNYKQEYLDSIAKYPKVIDSDLNWSNFILKPKTKKAPVLWFVSHCETASRREKYINELRKYIDIDIYGKCTSYFENSLPDPCPQGSAPNCFNDLMNSYKFYLSFENSLCDDYISEKYWKIYHHTKIFQVNILPITRGATIEQFNKVAIPNSLINAYNYKTPKQLSEYMNYLNQNDTAYLEYFRWKRRLFEKLEKNVKTTEQIENENDKTIFLASKARSPFCYICKQLHNKTYMESENNRVWKLSEWFGWKTSCWDEDEERRVPFFITQLLGFCF